MTKRFVDKLRELERATFEISPELGDFPGDPHRDCAPTGRLIWRFRAADGHIRATSTKTFGDADEARQDIFDFAEELPNLEAFGPDITECPA